MMDLKKMKIRAAKGILRAALDPSRPLWAHMVVTKRCNLSCGYCFEYDKVSKPVPIEILKNRVDLLKNLKVVFITLNGGEPLLHPQIVELVAYINAQNMIPMMNSNGRVLKPRLINQLNDAGLFGIQLSCDGMTDSELTQKSMKRLRPKLDMLQDAAKFQVRVNSVLGSTGPSEVIEVAKVVLDYGFDFQCSLVRDEKGAAIPLDSETQAAYMTIREMNGRLPLLLNDNFQLPLIRGEEVNWKCRSGARYFHLDAEGLVHFCQPRTGEPAIPLEEFTRENVKENFYVEKKCSKRCAHAYAHIGSKMDHFRGQSCSI